MARTIKTFSLSHDVCSALEARAKATDEKMSRLVEQGLRMLLALPITPREEGDETEEVATRAERTVLEVLRGMPPGVYFTHEINEVIVGAKNKPIGVALRSLSALARRGEVHLWSSEFPTGSEVQWSTWSMSKPAELVAKVIAVAGRSLSESERQVRVFQLVGALARKMTEADAAAARLAMLAEWPRVPDSVDVLIQTEAVHMQRESEARARKNAAWEAQQAAERRRAEEINAENARKHAAYVPPVGDAPQRPVCVRCEFASDQPLGAGGVCVECAAQPG